MKRISIIILAIFLFSGAYTQTSTYGNNDPGFDLTTPQPRKCPPVGGINGLSGPGGIVTGFLINYGVREGTNAFFNAIEKKRKERQLKKQNDPDVIKFKKVKTKKKKKTRGKKGKQDPCPSV